MSNDKINYNFYLLAFIDVLGQKEAFADLGSQPLTDDHPKLIEAHKQTAFFVETLRNAFKDFFGAYTEEREPKAKVPIKKTDQFKEMLKSNLQLRRFSDCIQAYVCLRTNKYHSHAINGVYGALIASGGMLLLTLASKKVYRAGIEVGLGTELEGGEIYGPVLYKAYELESKVAEYPRIVIGRELINYLTTLANGYKQLPSQTEEDIDLCRLMATNCLKMIVNDLDGVPILDYLGAEFLRSLNENPERKKELEDAFNKAFQFVKTEYEKRKREGNKKLALRYYLLLNYFKAKNPFPKENPKEKNI